MTELLDAARAGDEHAFGQLVDPWRGELHAWNGQSGYDDPEITAEQAGG